MGRRQIVIDAFAGVFVVLALAQLAWSRLRSLERERAAVAMSLEAMETKARELEAFAGRVAHDLRSPLAPVQALAGVLARGGRPDADVRRLAERIANAASRMNGVIEAMLEFSRSGRVPPGTCSPVAVVHDVVEELGPALEDVDLRVDVPDELVACSPEVLGQILRNLVGNAVKYRAHERPCQVEIRGAMEGPMLALTVVDNGIGMDAESARRVFEPFFRVREDRAGYGLGLSIVERYVHALHGSVQLHSEPEVGTRVELRLPRARKDAAGLKGVPAPPPPLSAAPPPHRISAG